MVCDFFKSRSNLLRWSKDAVELIGWLRRKDGILSELSLTIIRAVLTRWTCHYQAYSRLLQVRKELIAIFAQDSVTPRIVFIGDDEQRERAEEMETIIKNDDFWKGLLRMTLILEPLAIAANKLQATFIRLDVVLITFGHLLLSYRNLLNNPTVLEDVDDTRGISRIISSLEHRWKKCDQEAFVAALLICPLYGRGFLNPTHPLFIHANTMDFLCKMYCRLFQVDAAPDEFEDELEDFLKRRGTYESMERTVERAIRRAEEKVNILILIFIFNAASH